MRITFDPAKREWTLRERGLDFADAVEVFAGREVTVLSRQQQHGEDRYVTFGRLRGRLVVVVWTPRDDARRVISMRKCNAAEQRRLGQQLGPAGRDDG